MYWECWHGVIRALLAMVACFIVEFYHTLLYLSHFLLMILALSNRNSRQYLEFVLV